MGKSCFFIGHRDSPADVKTLLWEAIEKHIIEYGVTEFYVGHYGAFDYMAADVLCEMKERYPHIKNYLLLAYHPALRKVALPKGFDCALFPDSQEKSPPKYAIVNLNKRMIREADYLIAFSRFITDGSHKLLEYAAAKEKKGQIIITNLAQK
jgi:hypothetical protein